MRILSRIKHPFCGLSHWFGAGLAVVGTIALLVMAWGKPLALLAFTIYGLSLVALYTASALYHSLRCEGRYEVFLRKLDHTGIFLLIAGTYVPVCLLALSPAFGWTFLVLETLFALVGVVCTFLLRKFPAVLNVVLYLLMGWMALPALGWIGAHWPTYAIVLLVAGGIVYTIGAVIFATDRPHLWPGRFSAHDLWHIFVLGGSGCHFALMATYIVRTLH